MTSVEMLWHPSSN